MSGIALEIETGKDKKKEPIKQLFLFKKNTKIFARRWVLGAWCLVLHPDP
jgi:hypothetical protein